MCRTRTPTPRSRSRPRRPSCSKTRRNVKRGAASRRTPIREVRISHHNRCAWTPRTQEHRPAIGKQQKRPACGLEAVASTTHEIRGEVERQHPGLVANTILSRLSEPAGRYRLDRTHTRDVTHAYQDRVNATLREPGDHFIETIQMMRAHKPVALNEAAGHRATDSLTSGSTAKWYPDRRHAQGRVHVQSIPARRRLTRGIRCRFGIGMRLELHSQAFRELDLRPEAATERTPTAVRVRSRVASARCLVD